MSIKDAAPPPPANAAAARYRRAREIHDLLTEKWLVMRQGRNTNDYVPTFNQVEAVLYADEALRLRDGEPMRWGLG